MKYLGQEWEGQQIYDKDLYLDLCDQLVGDLLAEELVSLAVLHVDVELPDQLKDLVHAAARARRDRQLW